MGEGVERTAGKIVGLARFLTGPHGRALEYDLLVRGWRRRDLGAGLSWLEFEVLIEHLPLSHESAWYRARNPDDYWFGPTEQLSAAILHAVQSGNWQRGGGKGSRPTMFEPKRRRTGKANATSGATRETIRDELAARRKRAVERKLREAK